MVLRVMLAALLLAGALAVASITTGFHRVQRHPPGESARPLEVPTSDYVGSQACHACHPREHATWDDSFHRRMTQKATRQAVIARFDGVELEANGRIYALHRDGDEHWVEIRDASARPGTRFDHQRFVMTTGSHHQQIFWVDSGIGRAAELFPFLWVVEEQSWRPFASVFVRPPEKSPMPSPEPGEWSRNCNRCHSTFSRPRVGFDVDTQVTEFGIACEECHGPGGAHVRAHREPLQRFAAWRGDEPDPTIVQPERLDHRRSSQVCGQCHGVTLRGAAEMNRWNTQGMSFEPGDDLAASQEIVRRDTMTPALQEVLRDFPLFLDIMFWPDGVVRAAGREYSGFLDSGCFERGTISCLSCHVMHQESHDRRPVSEWRNDQMYPDRVDNRACTQCHEQYAGDAALTAHTRHVPASTGSSCFNCHMPHTTWALLKAVRNHHIDSPTVQQSLESGRPNACNLCHLDQTLAWTADHLSSWYGTEVPALGDDDRSIAAGIRWTMSGDAAQRALVAWSMGWAPAQEASGNAWLAPYLGQLLDDPYDVVRSVAHRSLRSLPGGYAAEYDYMQPAAVRTSAPVDVRSTWTKLGVPPAERHERLLLDPEGRLMEETYRRLLAARDDRDVILAE